jgi:hypothetical protein
MFDHLEPTVSRPDAIKTETRRPPLIHKGGKPRR